MTRKSLGRGLGSLIPESPSEKNSSTKTIDIDKIIARKEQPRKYFDQKSLDQLAQSIKQYGLLNPIVVREKGDKYEIIAGERRYRACKLIDLKEVEVIVKDFDSKEMDIISIVENIQREDLSALEEANAYNDLSVNHQMTQEEISNTVGKSRSYIANTMRLLKLDDLSKKELENNNISPSQARTLLSISDLEERKKTLDDFINKKTNIRQVEKKTKKNKKNVKKDKLDDLDSILFEDYEEKFMDLLGSKVSIDKEKDHYKLVIDCFSIDEIEKIYWRLKNEDEGFYSK